MNQQNTVSKPKNKIFKFLPTTSSSCTVQHTSVFSPGKDKRSSEKTHKSNLGIVFSGPLVSMIPADTCRKIKKGSTYTVIFEPTSPKVSCVGQVKHKHQKKKLPSAGGGGNIPYIAGKPTKTVPRTTSFPAVRTYRGEADHKKEAVETKTKKTFLRRNIFSEDSGAGDRKSDDTNSKSMVPFYLDKAASVRFSSLRDAFANFDGKTEFADVVTDDLSHHSGEEIDVNCSSSGGVCLGPRKEINLWKRRSIPQPEPIQLHTSKFDF